MAAQSGRNMYARGPSIEVPAGTQITHIDWDNRYKGHIRPDEDQYNDKVKEAFTFVDCSKLERLRLPGVGPSYEWVGLPMKNLTVVDLELYSTQNTGRKTPKGNLCFGYADRTMDWIGLAPLFDRIENVRELRLNFQLRHTLKSRRFFRATCHALWKMEFRNLDTFFIKSLCVSGAAP